MAPDEAGRHAVQTQRVSAPLLWLAEVPAIPGVLAYGQTRAEAIEKVQALALRALADLLDHGESIPQMSGVFAVAP